MPIVCTVIILIKTRERNVEDYSTRSTLQHFVLYVWYLVLRLHALHQRVLYVSMYWYYVRCTNNYKYLASQYMYSNYCTCCYRKKFFENFQLIAHKDSLVLGVLLTPVLSTEYTSS